MAKKITYFFGADITELERGWKRIDRKMGKLSANMEKVGRTMSRAFTAPLVGIGALAMREAINIETAFARVRKTVSGTEAEMKALEKGIMDMSQKMPSSAVAIAEVAQAAGQLGIQRDSILSFSKAMVQLGETSNLNSADGAAALAQFANITRMSQKDFDRLASTIVALGNSLATTEKDVVEMGHRIAGAGAQIGMTEAEIMAFAGALASVGIEAQMGGTALSRVMVEMKLATVKGGQDLKNFAAVAKMSAGEFKAAFEKNAADAMVRFIQGLADLEGSGTSAIEVLDKMGISEVRVRDALLRSAGASDVLKTSLALARDEWERNSALAEKTAIIYDTTGSKLQMMRNQMSATGKEIGDKLTPHLLKLTEKTRDVVKAFSDLSPEAQDTTIKLAAITAAIGPLLIAISATLKSVRTLGTALLAFATGPAAPLIATAAAVWAIVEAFTALNDMMSKTSELQKKATGMTPEQVMNRQRYREMAGEIYRERHGKYPVTAPDFKELDSIVDELLAEARKRMQHQIDMKGYAPRTEGGATPAPATGGTTSTAAEIEALLAAMNAAEKKPKKKKKEYSEIAAALSRETNISAAEAEKYINILTKALGISETEAAKRIEASKAIGERTADEIQALKERNTVMEESKNIAAEVNQTFASEDAARSLESLRMQLDIGNIGLEQYREALTRIREQFAMFPGVVEQIDAAMRALDNSILASTKTLGAFINEAQTALRDKLIELPDKISGAFASAIVYGENLGDTLKRLAQDIAAVAIKAILLKTIFGGGGIGKLFGFADGAAFSGGKIIPFAKGGIVTRPTIFPMAKGAGLMGEAGPEAIMPLKRGADGSLGVQSEGGGGTHITMNINAVDSRSFVEMMRSNRASVESIVVENIMKNGALRSAIRGLA